MFQDITPYHYCNDFAWVAPESTDRVLIYNGSRILVALDSHKNLHFPSYHAFDTRGALAHTATSYSIYKDDGDHLPTLFLFSVGDTAYFRCEIKECFESNPEALLEQLNADSHTNDLTWNFMSLSDLHHYAPRHRVFAGMVGYTYHTWYDTRRFCGRCGTKLVHDGVERMLRCPQCKTMEFPKLFPAVIVGIVDPQTNRVLVSRYANREYKRYALIAGFSEMGETVEQTVHREVMEEVGLHVKNLRYYKSQPWPASSSLLFGFFCELDGQNDITLDEHELEHAEWLPREELPSEDADYSLTRDMMRVLREGDEIAHPVVEQ